MANKTTADIIFEAHNAGAVGDAAVAAALGAIATDALKVKAQIVALVDLSGTVGTANNAMIAVPASTVATTFAEQKTQLDAAITAINNNLADLQAKVNALHAALKA